MGKELRRRHRVRRTAKNAVIAEVVVIRRHILVFVHCTLLHHREKLGQINCLTDKISIINNMNITIITTNMGNKKNIILLKVLFSWQYVLVQKNINIKLLKPWWCYSTIYTLRINMVYCCVLNSLLLCSNHCRLSLSLDDPLVETTYNRPSLSPISCFRSIKGMVYYCGVTTSAPSPSLIWLIVALALLSLSLFLSLYNISHCCMRHSLSPLSLSISRTPFLFRQHCCSLSLSLSPPPTL